MTRSNNGSFDSVEVDDEVDDAAVVPEDLLDGFVGPFVAKDDLEALVEEGHLPQALDECLRAEIELFHDRAVGPERDRGSRVVGVADALQRCDGFAAVDERLLEAAAVAVDDELEPARQRVHDGNADAVEPTGDLVALAAELAAGVEHREHDLGRRLVGVLGMRVDRDAPPVVDDAAAAIGQKGHIDAGCVARERLVDRVVDHLVDEVMEPRRAG